MMFVSFWPFKVCSWAYVWFKDPKYVYEEPSCGNGELDTGEECDDDNTINGDGCSSECEIEVEPPEGLVIFCDKGDGREITVTYPDGTNCWDCYDQIGVTGTPTITEIYLLENFIEIPDTRCSSQPCSYDQDGCLFNVAW